MGTMITTPEGIAAFGLLQIYYKLKLEVNNPGGPKWRMSPSQQARQILIDAGKPDPGRTKKKVLDAYKDLLTENGLEPSS